MIALSCETLRLVFYCLMFFHCTEEILEKHFKNLVRVRKFRLLFWLTTKTFSFDKANAPSHFNTHRRMAARKKILCILIAKVLLWNLLWLAKDKLEAFKSALNLCEWVIQFVKYFMAKIVLWWFVALLSCNT